MHDVGIQTTVQIATTASSLGVRLTCSVELCAQSPVPPSSPTDWEIDPRKRPKAAALTALPPSVKEGQPDSPTRLSVARPEGRPPPLLSRFASRVAGWRAAACLPAAAFALTLGAGAALAQTPETLISNTGQTTSDGGTFTFIGP